jgi:uncharacterized membrane protein (DUF485 family)
MVYYDCLVFELTNIRLGGQDYLEWRLLILILCFYFILELETISFQPTFLKLWVIQVHVSLGIIVSFKLLEFGYIFVVILRTRCWKNQKLETLMVCIHNWGTKKEWFIFKGLQRTSLDSCLSCIIIIVMDCCMLMNKMIF